VAVQGISTAALDMFKRLENEMKPTKNYQLYREKMQKLKKENIPLLPWLGTSPVARRNCCRTVRWG